MAWGVCAALPPAAPAQTSRDVQAREVEVLRRTIAEQQSNPAEIIRTPQTLAFSTNAVYSARRVELENQYLEGKLTAKQFQKALDSLRQEERRRPTVETAAAAASVKKPAAGGSAPASAGTPSASVASPPKSVTAPASAAVPAPAASASPAAAPGTSPAGQPKSVSEVESKLEEMLRLKEARDKAALTNAVAGTNAAPAGPMTQRQKLDAILKQYVNGQISEADYNAKRAKIVAEPD
jgi:hypothetical protein